VHALARASSVDSVVRVTGNFASEGPLHPAAREALLAAFDQGWADPKKLSQNSSKAAILRNHALETISSRLAIAVDSIEVLGEPSLGHFLSIAGLFQETSTFAYSAIDKGKIRAIARSRNSQVTELAVDSSGAIQGLHEISDGAVLSLQLANGETGIIQDSFETISKNVRIAVDATAAGSRVALPDRWDTALFDAPSWGGPSGLAIMAIRNRSHFSYPLPRIAPISSPGSYSLPLLIASAVALENFTAESTALREHAITKLSKLDGVRIVAPQSPSLPHLISLVAEGVSGENVIRELAAQGIDVDSGSACSAEDLQPSHVLAAMGYETNGHIRLTMHNGTTEADIASLAPALSGVLQKLRG
jgi:cysteine desulfurase